VVAVVDHRVARDDALGELHVRVEQRGRRAAHRRRDQVAEVDESGGNAVETLVVRVAHGLPPRPDQQRTGAGGDETATTR
jgi:hypothetical protein